MNTILYNFKEYDKDDLYEKLAAKVDKGEPIIDPIKMFGDLNDKLSFEQHYIISKVIESFETANEREKFQTANFMTLVLYGITENIKLKEEIEALKSSHEAAILMFLNGVDTDEKN